MLTTKEKAVLDLICSFGGIDGAHHKQWLLDQIVRTITDCPLISKETLDIHQEPYLYEALGESEEYLSWVEKYQSGENGPNTYTWDTGVVP